MSRKGLESWRHTRYRQAAATCGMAGMWARQVGKRPAGKGAGDCSSQPEACQPHRLGTHTGHACKRAAQPSMQAGSTAAR